MHVVTDGKNMSEKSVTIGNVAQEKTIKEAVIAVPFTVKNNERYFFKLPRAEIYKAVQNNGYEEYQKDFVSNIEKTLGTDIVVRTHIQTMVNRMFDYVIPPKMNFIKYSTEGEKYVEPFAMYIFEFKHKLSSEDLSHMWQNLPPKIGLDNFHNSEEDDIFGEDTVSHDLFGEDGMLREQMNEDVKWMIFKVKQKAEVSYFKKMERDKFPVGHPNKQKDINDVFEYGYNWPYDYFSMVELIKLDAEVGFLAGSGFSSRTQKQLLTSDTRNGE